MDSFFQGLKVVDMSSVLAGPLTGSFFAELGASVIKIENRKSAGDATRQWKLPVEDPASPYSAYYAAANYGKEELMLDLSAQEDLYRLYVLVKDADVVISNFQKATAEKLGVHHEKITSLNPKIIFAQLSAYSYDDPRPGYDLVMQAETGYISMTGTEEGRLCKIPVAMIDILAAHQMKEAILIGLLHKFRTGQGCTIHVSLYQSAISGLVNQASNYLMCSHIPKPLGTLHPNIAPYGEILLTKDGKQIMLAIGSDAQFEKLWKTLNLSQDNYPNFGQNNERIKHRGLLLNILQEKVSQFTLEELSTKFAELNLPFSIIKNMEEVFNDPLSKKMIRIEQKPGGYCLKSVGSIAFDLLPATV